MKLNQLSDNPGANKARMRVGRGIGSGKGKTSARGQKGQKARNTVAVGFEGGQMPIYRRLPKRGFNNISRKEFAVLNIGRLQKAIDDKKVDASQAITIDVLVKAGVVDRHFQDGVRLLGNGEITSKINIEVNGATKSAISAVEKTGGSVKIA